MTSKLLFGDCAELRQEKIDPKQYPDANYIGLEHIAQESLILLGYGKGNDVDSQKQKFYEGDILFGKLRPYFRKVIIAPFDGICSTDIWVVQPKANIDRDFLFYWMASKEFIDSASVASEGTRMPRAKWDWVTQFEVPMKNHKEQISAARTLRLLDRKIQQNAILSETLEAIAQSIFKSWFIDFDPVHAQSRCEKPFGMDDATAALFPDSFEESEIGITPMGWRANVLGDVLSVLESGKRPKGGAQSVGVPSIGAESIRNLGQFDYASTKYVSQQFFQDMKSGKVNPYDVLIYKDGAGAGAHVTMFGEGFPYDSFAINEHVFLLRSNQAPQPYLFFWLKNEKYKSLMIELAQKSAQPGLNQKDMKSIPILIPDSFVLNAFSEIVSPIVKMIMKNSLQNVSLEQIREGLLPKLIYGDLPLTEELLVS